MPLYCPSSPKLFEQRSLLSYCTVLNVVKMFKPMFCLFSWAIFWAIQLTFLMLLIQTLFKTGLTQRALGLKQLRSCSLVPPPRQHFYSLVITKREIIHLSILANCRLWNGPYFRRKQNMNHIMCLSSLQLRGIQQLRGPNFTQF